jgi:hypothetical protein
MEDDAFHHEADEMICIHLEIWRAIKQKVTSPRLATHSIGAY